MMWRLLAWFRRRAGCTVCGGTLQLRAPDGTLRPGLWWDDPCGYCGALICDVCDEASLRWWFARNALGPRRAGHGCGHGAYMAHRDLLVPR
jgi:hypothetical protein